MNTAVKIMFGLLLLALLAQGCGNTDGEVRIGVILPLSGDFMSDGRDAESVLSPAQKEARSGDLDVIFIKLDNGSSPKLTIECVEKLIALDVSIIVGPLYSVNAKAAAPAAEDGGTPLLLPLATLPGVTDNKFAFRACFTDTWQAYAMADYVFEELELRSMVSVTNLGDHYSVGLSRDFEAIFSELGGEIIGRIYYRTLIDESTRILEYLTATSPDLVFIPCYDQDAISFLQAAEGVLSSLTIVGSDGWDTRDFRETEIPSGTACRLLISNHFNLSAEGQARKSGKLGSNPGQAAALTFDALQIAVEAVRLAKSAAPGDVMEALRALDNFSGVTGNFNYKGGENGDPLKPVFIQEIRRGADGLPVFVDLEARMVDNY